MSPAPRKITPCDFPGAPRHPVHRTGPDEDRKMQHQLSPGRESRFPTANRTPPLGSSAPARPRSAATHLVPALLRGRQPAANRSREDQGAPCPEVLLGGTNDPATRNLVERPKRSTTNNFPCRYGRLGGPQASIDSRFVCQVNPLPARAKKRRITRARNYCSDGVGNVDITDISDAFFLSNACII
jgi:hypothetical protein